MKKSHGATGESGFGLTHGYDKDDEADNDNSHEFRGGTHGAAWKPKKRGKDNMVGTDGMGRHDDH